MRQFIWGLAEFADWHGWPPRRFWMWLLKRMDRANGYDLTYDE